MICVTSVNLIIVNKIKKRVGHLPSPASPKLALFSRQHPSQRPNASLQPVASTDTRQALHRRVSRTDLDFEQALRQEGTFVFKEGIDVNSLGVDNSPANRSMASPASRGIARVALQPATPTIVPPTPSPGPSGSSSVAPTAHAAAPSPASSSYDLAADADEAERQMHRRSIYRSPGTSSSPDLATLLRRARERGGAVAGGKKEKEREKERRREREPPGGYEQQTLRQSTGTYSSATLVAAPTAFGERAREEQGAERPKEGTVKVRALRCF